MILEIPDDLRQAFLDLFEPALTDMLLDFGGDMTENEIKVVEFMEQFIFDMREIDARNSQCPPT